MNGFSHKPINYSKQVLSGFKALRSLRLSHLRKVFSLMGRKEKIAILILLVIAMASLGLSARNFYLNNTVLAPDQGGIYTEGFLGQPTYINPLLAYQETDLGLTRLVYTGLYKYDGKGELVPDLADGQPEISPDQKQYTINLKRGVKWHNDKPFNADDVVFTVQTLKDPNFKSPLRSSWMSTNVEKLGDFTVKFTTKDISGPFIHNLTLPILPQAVWSRVDPQNFLLSKNNLEAVGTGPFAIKEIQKLPSGKIQKMTLEAFGDYYAGRPKLNNVIVNFYDTEEDMLNALHSKEISGFGFVSLGSTLYLEKEQSDLDIYSLPMPQYQMVFFNLNNKILSDQNIRLALTAATDRQKIITEVFKDRVLLPVSPYAQASTAAAAQGSEANLQKAKKLLDDAGWKVDAKTGLRANKKNTPLELTISTNDFLLNSKAAEALANQWKDLNIKVNMTVLPTKQLTDSLIHPRSFDVLLFPLKFGADPDPFPFWHSSQVKDPGYNLTGFADPNADRLITEARTTTNQELRMQKYGEFERLVTAKAAGLYLDQALYIYALDKNIKNVSLEKISEPSQRFYDLANWYMKEKRVWK